jgi:aldose 1-epimerase
MTRTLRLAHPDGLSLTLGTLGASWLSCEVPMPDGARRRVILERPAQPDEATRRAYIGATVGRYANRIDGARIAWGSQAWRLEPNTGSPHQLHGGPAGFDAREWTVVEADDRSARLALVSPDGDQGYPGELHAEVTYRLADAMTIEMDARATVSSPSPVCLTNHAYFNLDGRPGDVRAHRLRIASSRFVPVDRDLIPLGPLADVQGTGFDFRSAKTVMTDWLRDQQQGDAGGYDHAWLLDDSCAELREPAAELVSSDGRLRMALSTTLPALQFYAGQLLSGAHEPCAAMALEPEFLPDSPNHPEWPQPSCWLQPGQTYRHVIRYAFSTGIP